MRVTVSQLPNAQDTLDSAWRGLVMHVRQESPDLVLLPEMPFHGWPMARRELDPEAWNATVAAHETWLSRLDELAPAVVVATRPVTDGRQRYNEGFLWIPGAGYQAVHRKVYLPDEEGFWEASWYQPGPPEFRRVEVQGLRLGFLICTEQWFFEHARQYGQQGAHLIVSPRATLAPSTEKWVAGGRSVATVSGAYHLSANLAGASDLATPWGGTGWIIEPEEGEVLGRTSAEQPFLTLEIDPREAERAKGTYPRYVHPGPRTKP
jgi:N-carbamoylputrescine amidase